MVIIIYLIEHTVMFLAEMPDRLIIRCLYGISAK